MMKQLQEFSTTGSNYVYYTTEMNYDGRTYQLTFDKDSAESPGWMEVSSYIVPTVNLSYELNRLFLDKHASEVLARWDKDCGGPGLTDSWRDDFYAAIAGAFSAS